MKQSGAACAPRSPQKQTLVCTGGHSGLQGQREPGTRVCRQRGQERNNLNGSILPHSLTPTLVPGSSHPHAPSSTVPPVPGQPSGTSLPGRAGEQPAVFLFKLRTMVPCARALDPAALAGTTTLVTSSCLMSTCTCCCKSFAEQEGCKHRQIHQAQAMQGIGHRGPRDPALPLGAHGLEGGRKGV